MKKVVLVTGGAGYVGSVLLPKLIINDYSVRVLDTMWFTSKGLDPIKGRCEIIKGDIRNSKLVRECLKGVNCVIHLAAIANDPSSKLYPQLTQEVNFEATKSLVKESKKRGVERFIYASSSSVYGIRDEKNVTEDLSLEPLTIYSKTKAWSEKVLKEYNDEEFTTVSIRSGTIGGYSSRQRLDVIVNILSSRAINKGEIVVNGGKQKRPTVDIDDITNLYLNLISVPKEKISGESFNYNSENNTVEELAERVKRVIGNHVKIIRRPPTPDSRSYHISSEKVKRLLGVYPQKKVEDSVLSLKYAFETGLIPNSDSDIYRNIKVMEKIGYTRF